MVKKKKTVKKKAVRKPKVIKAVKKEEVAVVPKVSAKKKTAKQPKAIKVRRKVAVPKTPIPKPPFSTTDFDKLVAMRASRLEALQEKARISRRTEHRLVGYLQGVGKYIMYANADGTHDARLEPS